MKRMAFRVVDHVLVLIHAAEDPSDDEWALYLKEIKRQGTNLLPQIVVTEGGRPNLLQRKLLTDVLAGRVVKVAVLSDQTMVRGVVTAISWFNRDIKAFSGNNLMGAMTYLDVPDRLFRVIQSVTTGLRDELKRAA